MFSQSFNSELGLVEVCATDDGLCSVSLGADLKDIYNPNVHTNLAVEQLKEYFSGNRKEFDLKLSPKGTEFQQKVWVELSKIPHGKTVSYLDISVSMGDRNLTRAVGMANGKNPIAIIVPCHRVIGSSGDLTGYAGGLWRKQWLLEHEGVLKLTQTNLFDE